MADRVLKAWLRTLEDGVHTYDIFSESVSCIKATTQQFTEAVIDRLGVAPKALEPIGYRFPSLDATAPITRREQRSRKEIVGADVFLHWNSGSAQDLAIRLQQIDLNGFTLSMITNRGVKVWPDGLPETFCTDHWRCRFVVADGQDSTDHLQILGLLENIAAAGLDFIKTENLCTFDGEPGYSLGQGQ
jgi:isocitrate dehydrogenase